MNYTHKGTYPVDAGHVAIIDIEEYGLGVSPDLEVEPGKYEVSMQGETWAGNNRPPKTLETKSGKLHFGDSCYLHSPHYVTWCDNICGKDKPLSGFVAFNTGGDGHFRLEFELRSV
jgi:hypothetical protein